MVLYLIINFLYQNLLNHENLFNIYFIYLNLYEVIIQKIIHLYQHNQFSIMKQYLVYIIQIKYMEKLLNLVLKVNKNFLSYFMIKYYKLFLLNLPLQFLFYNKY